MYNDKRWPASQRFSQETFPGASLGSLRFLHIKNKILFHGVEPLDTDTTPTLEVNLYPLKRDVDGVMQPKPQITAAGRFWLIITQVPTLNNV